MRLIGGLLVAFLAQVAGLVLLAALGVQYFPPSWLQLLPAVAAGQVFAHYSRHWPLAAAAAVPPGLLTIWLDRVVDPGIAPGSLVWALGGALVSALSAYAALRLAPPGK